MSDRKFRIGLCQLLSRTDKEENMQRAEAMVREAAAGGASVVVLPEVFQCPFGHEYFEPYSEVRGGVSMQRMAQWAKELGIVLIAGSVTEKAGKKLYNTSYVFDRDGSLLTDYRKVHLFDVDIPDKMTFQESDSFASGEDICVFDTDVCRIGLAICYDLRFPEQFRAMARRGAELIVLPAKFTTPTGEAHWELLTRARALDNELFFAACCGARAEDGQPYGHSCVIGPFGDIRAACGEEETVLFCDIDLAEVDAVRRQIPAFTDLRDDLYKVAD